MRTAIALDVTARTLAILGLVWCLASGWILWTTPVESSGIEWRPGPDGPRRWEVARSEPFAEQSPHAVLLLSVPILLAAGGVGAAWQRRFSRLAVSAVLLLAYSLVAGFSIGGAYVGAGGLLLASCASVAAGRRLERAGPA